MNEDDELPFARICTISVNVEGVVNIDADGWLSLLPESERTHLLYLAAETLRDLVAELPEPTESEVVSLVKSESQEGGI